MQAFIRFFTAWAGLGIQARQRRDAGATATEYAMLVAFIALAIVIGIAAFGTALAAFWDQIAELVASFI